MGIFDFLISKASRENSSTSHLDGLAHHRYHARFILNNRDLCMVEHPKHGMFRVVDLSHQGCMVESISDSSFDTSNFPLLMDLSLCGSSIKVEVSQTQRRRGGWALVFRHVHEQSVKALGEFIEPLRMGSSAVLLEANAERDGIHWRRRRRFVGDGSFELVYEKSESGDLSFFMVTMRLTPGAGSVIWNQGEILTKKSPETEGAFMPKTPQVDDELVWTCAASCLGMKFLEGAIVAKVLHNWLNSKPSSYQLAKSS